MTRTRSTAMRSGGAKTASRCSPKGYFFLNEKDITQPIKGWGHNQFRTALWVKLRERSTGKEFFFFNTHLAHRASPVEGRRHRSGGAHRVGETHRRTDEADRGTLRSDLRHRRHERLLRRGRRPPRLPRRFLRIHVVGARNGARRRSRRRLQLQQLRRRHSALYVEHRPHLLPQGDARPVPHHQQRRLRRSHISDHFPILFTSEF